MFYSQQTSAVAAKRELGDTRLALKHSYSNCLVLRFPQAQ